MTDTILQGQIIMPFNAMSNLGGYLTKYCIQCLWQTKASILITNDIESNGL